MQASSLRRFCLQKRCFQPSSGAGRAEAWGSAQMGLGAGCEVWGISEQHPQLPPGVTVHVLSGQLHMVWGLVAGTVQAVGRAGAAKALQSRDVLGHIVDSSCIRPPVLPVCASCPCCWDAEGAQHQHTPQHPVLRDLYLEREQEWRNCP